MKRKWLFAATLSVLVGAFIMAKNLSDKRPRFFASIPHAVQLTFSPDGRKLFVQQAEDRGEIIDVASKERTNIAGVQPLSHRFFFAPNNEDIMQFCLAGHETMNFATSEFNVTVVEPRICAYGGSYGKDLFTFSLPTDCYGAYLRNGEIVCESRTSTSTRNCDSYSYAGGILSTTPRKRVLAGPAFASGGIHPDDETIVGAALVPDGKTLWTYRNGKYQFWDLNTQKPLWTLASYGSANIEEVPAFQPSLDGRLILAQKDRSIVAYNTRTGTEQWRVFGPQSLAFALSPDERTIYEARTDGQIWVWPV